MAKKESYESNLQKLKDILDSLEGSELSLEESMKAYEDGVKLVNKLHKTLNTLEGKIAIIKDDEEVEFNGDNEN